MICLNVDSWVVQLRLRLGMLAKKNPSYFVFSTQGGLGGSKIRIVFETPKNERFSGYFEGKNRSFFEVLKTRVRVVAIFNCLDETKYERFFFICKHPLTGQLAVREIGENKSCNKVSLQI